VENSRQNHSCNQSEQNCGGGSLHDAAWTVEEIMAAIRRSYITIRNRQTLDRPNSGDIVIICGWYIAAYSIIDSLKSVGWQGRIICVNDTKGMSVLADLLKPGVEVWSPVLQQPSDLVDQIAADFPKDSTKYVIFSDERFHEAFLDEIDKARIDNLTVFIGSRRHLDVTLDRFKFYNFIEQNKLADVPKTIPGVENPWEYFSVPFCARLKYTWNGFRRLDRLKIIDNPDVLEKTLEKWRSQGHASSDWCFQELLSIDPRHNISICGWHDNRHQDYFTTRHILRHPNEVGNGDVTEIIDPPAGLLQSTRKILEALEYEGPFELEFLLDMKTGNYKAIELNPRFWMQHGLVEAASDHLLIRRYIGRSTQKGSTSRSRKRYWVNTVYAFFRLLKLDLRPLPYLCSKETVCVPRIGIAMKWAPRHQLNQMLFR
jgi:hypothetical protein